MQTICCGAQHWKSYATVTLTVGRSGRAHRALNDLADDHEDDSGVNASAQRRPMPVCPAERSGQPSEKRQGRDRVDRREERRKILADFN